MLLYGHVYTSDRAELRIVSQTLRGLSLYSGSNSADSEDRRMIDGISKATIVTVVPKDRPLMLLFVSAMDTRCITNREETRKLVSKVAGSIIEF